jgi:hypothetical protein
MLQKHVFRWFYISDFIQIIDYYTKSLSGKVLPAFDDISEEADKVVAEAYHRLASLSDPEWFDPGDIVEDVNNAGLEFYMMAHGVKQGIINMFTAGLYHLFEQQLLRFHREQLLEPEEKSCTKLFSCDEAQQRLLENYRIDISTFPSWNKIQELRLVANTVKHADGPSCTKLKQIRPDLFIRPYQGNESPWPVEVAHRQVVQPLAGKDLYITLDEFTKYVDATKQVWEELANAVDQLPG